MKKYLVPILMFFAMYSMVYVGLEIYLLRNQYAMFVVGMAIISGIVAKKVEELLKK